MRLVPRAGRLLEPVEGSRKQADVIRMSGVDESGGLLAEHLLGEVAVKKCVGDIQLMHRPYTRHSEL